MGISYSGRTYIAVPVKKEELFNTLKIEYSCGEHKFENKMRYCPECGNKLSSKTTYEPKPAYLAYAIEKGFNLKNLWSPWCAYNEETDEWIKAPSVINIDDETHCDCDPTGFGLLIADSDHRAAYDLVALNVLFNDVRAAVKFLDLEYKTPALYTQRYSS